MRQLREVVRIAEEPVAEGSKRKNASETRYIEEQIVIDKEGMEARDTSLRCGLQQMGDASSAYDSCTEDMGISCPRDPMGGKEKDYPT